MTVKHSKEANLRPLNGQVGLALRLKNVEDDRHSILIIFPYYSLVSVRSVGLDKSTFLLRSFCWLVVFK